VTGIINNDKNLFPIAFILFITSAILSFIICFKERKKCKTGKLRGKL
jgi:hypothetical protein